MNWFLKALNQYADFKGRARRKEYWMFYLFSTLIYLITLLLDEFIGNFFTTLYTIAIITPSLAVGARRLHDVGKNGWWLLIAFVPLVGPLYLLFLVLKDSDPLPNQYGKNPKNGVEEKESDYETQKKKFISNINNIVGNTRGKAPKTQSEDSVTNQYESIPKNRVEEKENNYEIQKEESISNVDNITSNVENVATKSQANEETLNNDSKHSTDFENKPEPSNKFCTSCGNQLKPGTKFCTNCGERV